MVFTIEVFEHHGQGTAQGPRRSECPGCQALCSAAWGSNYAAYSHVSPLVCYSRTPLPSPGTEKLRVRALSPAITPNLQGTATTQPSHEARALPCALLMLPYGGPWPRGPARCTQPPDSREASIYGRNPWAPSLSAFPFDSAGDPGMGAE